MGDYSKIIVDESGVLTKEMILEAREIIKKRSGYIGTMVGTSGGVDILYRRLKELEEKEKHLKKISKTPLWKVLNE